MHKNTCQRLLPSLLAARRAGFGYPERMHIIIVAWLYFAVLVAATEPTLVGSIMSFVCYGALPVAIIAYIGRTGQRKKRRRLDQLAGQQDGGDAKRDQGDLPH
jgi:hypothetical protein